MFDIGFSEIMLIAVVVLVVVGPERLPKVARTMGHLAGRLQRYVAQVKADISQELEIDEMGKFKSQFQDAAQSWRQAITTEIEQTGKTLNEAVEGVTASGEGGAAHTPPTDARPSPQLEMVADDPSPQLELDLPATKPGPDGAKTEATAAMPPHQS
jgi:sec-independent protein translocase protein TatB